MCMKAVSFFCSGESTTSGALVANLESREWRRKFNTAHGLVPEHPRASTTDDVECFFSLLRDNVGKVLHSKKYVLMVCKCVSSMLYNAAGVLWMEKGD